MKLIPYLEKAGPDFRPALKLAYEEFLQYFPLCFGYWHRHAKLMRQLAGDDAAVEVYERGLQAVNCLGVLHRGGVRACAYASAV